MTFFFNGGLEQAHTKEDRQLVPSPRVPTYDLKPEMSADGVAKAVSLGGGPVAREIKNGWMEEHYSLALVFSTFGI